MGSDIKTRIWYRALVDHTACRTNVVSYRLIWSLIVGRRGYRLAGSSHTSSRTRRTGTCMPATWHLQLVQLWFHWRSSNARAKIRLRFQL